MNTSTNTNRSSGLLRRTMAGVLLGIAITTTAVGFAAAPAHADAGCKIERWGFLGSQLRTLCDGPVSSDGSWSRHRIIVVPAHYSTPICTSGGGSYSSYTHCSGGYLIRERLVSDDTYPVRPETVLHDEPGHLG
jgi:hypothetical protein